MSGNGSEREWTPVEDRRRFLAAVGAAAGSTLAGCVFGGGNGGGNGGGDGDGNGGGDGDSDPGEGGVDTVPPSENPAMPEDRRAFLVSGGEAETTFDATLSDATVYVGGDTIEAVVDADLDSHRYVLDEGILGSDLSAGDVLLVSGVALRKVTSIEREGSEATVDTEPAALNEAIAEGEVGWDAEVGFDFDHAPDSDARTGTGSVVRSGGGAGAPSVVPRGADDVFFAGVEMIGGEDDKETVGVPDLERTAEGLKWKYSDGGLDYVFEITKPDREVTVSVTVQKVVGDDPKMALVAEGTVGRARSVASAEYAEEELDRLDLQNDEVGGEITVEVNAAAAGDGAFDWEFPGFMFKFVVMAGPVPVTIGYAPKVIGKYVVPARGSASASATFEFDSSVGFEYAGGDASADASVGRENIDPDPADSAANIGNPVDLQFGLAFPRLTVSVFEQGLIPFVHAGVTVGSRLTWGPVCKSSYVRFVVQAGYDFEVMGVNFASDKETLYENKLTARGDSCKDGRLVDFRQ